ncbi:galactose-1-phosphate uridylyltransferase [Calderihabitans maritimus]|uniref:Galactose-1-phosphate uridylyltransferase n=1 Tax=Calderihabitans maritimus TaxID=1246530 RepID=A0A1Z5HPX8_9FIRM|nr:galactose-1-phosphate uridylyltransferase [Calderihabitans maritimus]GAW91592.1 galactose-1-phosphate uridylyltransferase [Calderihabitans maritimus]
MPELRKDPVTGTWVVIATERAKRPSDFVKSGEKETDTKKGGFCPFCPGNEKSTPPEVFAFREEGTNPDEEGWSVRVVPNKFAALEPGVAPERHEDSLHETMNGVGAHEVIIETPEHEAAFPELSLEQMVRVVEAWKERYQALSTDKKIRYTQIFRNHGPEAGASLEHPHSQLIATPVVPKTILEELEGVHKYDTNFGKCIYCELLNRELLEETRIVYASAHFVAFCPYASRFPFEIWIIPRQHQEEFGEISSAQIEGLAGILKEITGRLRNTLQDPPYNLVLHTAPYGSDKMYHWHIEILPRLTKVAGFEWGTGFYINPTTPESSAENLR